MKSSRAETIVSEECCVGIFIYSPNIFWHHTHNRILNEELYTHIIQKLFFSTFIYTTVLRATISHQLSEEMGYSIFNG